MKIHTVEEEAFRKYGRVLNDCTFDSLLEALQDTPVPEDVIYVPSDVRLERSKEYGMLEQSVYGGMPIQIGFCNGHNQKLNGLEYHRSSEINIAGTDMILLLGCEQDIQAADVEGTVAYTYDTAKVEAFLVPKNTAVEIYATTLHYAPCGIDGAGFQCAVVLPKGTNYEICTNGKCSEDILLAATNKWLIAHKEAQIAGAYNGLVGENLTV